MKILTVVGARPQFIKAAVVSRALAADPQQRIREVIIHTGQHYDQNMSDVFFVEMGIPEPAANLQIGSGGHGEVTARMLTAIEAEIVGRQPDAVLVYGDTTSTLAGALAASKLHVPVVHVEAGLRSFNRRMPEEVNRVITDHVSSLLLCPTFSAVSHLKSEGIVDGVHHIGDVMCDAAKVFGEIAQKQSRVLNELRITSKQFFLATVHRAENTDDSARLKGIFEALLEIATDECPVILPLHPRTKNKLEEHQIHIDSGSSLKIIPPLSFLDMVMLEKCSRLIFTDSGGVQKEAYFHGVPCVTLRDETEWTETVAAGWNQVVGADPQAIIQAVASSKPGTPIHEYGDGNASQQVVDLISSMPLKRQ